ncbi:WhiB family transcriptional regulator [Rhodococcus rhodnii]|uniref:WhiB family transcriptional regulator n=1 Tax=Rhodococcus rhodnii TaxID=38312 RepID=UPI000933905F|nr:WhiB family transcriptional regulator [Rhodococcus rhodnii]
MGNPLPTWRERAVCAQIDPDLFFPEAPRHSGAASRRPQVRAAQEICRSCPVRGECLSWAIERGERYGIWGGVLMEAIRTQRRRLAVEEMAQVNA